MEVLSPVQCVRLVLWMGFMMTSKANLADLFRASLNTNPANTTCITCTKTVKDIHLMRQHRKNLRIQHIKDDLLIKLGLHKKPDMPSSSSRTDAQSRSVQRALTKLRMAKAARDRRGSREGPSDYFNEILEIISLSEEAPGLDGNDALGFTLHANNQEGQIVVLRASLWVLMRYPRHKKDNSTITGKVKPRLPKKVKLKVTKIDTKTGESKIVATSVLKVRHTSWKQLILPTSLIRNTIQSPNHNLVFRVTCDGCSRQGPEMILLHKHRRRRRTRTIKRHRRRLHKRRPFLIIETKMAETSYSLFRVKRNIRPRGCRLRRSYVTFREMNWDDWIISPSGFSANWCSGRCRAERDTHKKTCQPARRSSLQLRYFDGDKVVNATLDNWIVESCGCK